MSSGQALKTDLYQITMAAAYFHNGFRDTHVTCEAFLRRLPPRRSFLVMAGTARLAEYLADLRFTSDEIAYLRSLPQLAAAMTDDFCRWLADFHFRGDVWAAPEGTVVFANEPLVRVTGNLIEAQLVETYLLSVLNHGLKVASKAARVVLAAGKAQVIEFGSRRTHDEAAVDAARAAYVAGCAATANVAAGFRHGIPVAGTAAHMFTMAFARAGVPSAQTELESFEAYVRTFPHQPTLLVDTYDTPRGVDNAIRAAGISLGGVRLDSGDLLALSRDARARLDAAGLDRARIIASSGLDEHEVARLMEAGAPIDAFGVGENITEPVDAPITGCVYKLVYNHTSRVGVAKKSSGGKSTRPGVKQVWRLPDRDVVGLADETPPAEGRALLQPLLEAGRVLAHEPVAAARERCAADLAALPAAHRHVPADAQAPLPPPYVVEISARLQAETERALSG